MEPRARLVFDNRVCLPNHALFIGPTQSGKTTLCLHLLTQPHLFNPKPARIIFHYDQFQDQYINAKNLLAKEGIEFLLYKGMPDKKLGDYDVSDGQTILLVDDFSEETSSSGSLAHIATNGRHKNISLWLVWHSLYSKHAASRIICQNVRYYFFLPSLRLESQLRVFGSQMGIKTQLLWAYKQCREQDEKYRYVLVDGGPLVPDVLRVRSHIHCANEQFCYF